MNFTETFQKNIFAPKWDFFALFEKMPKKKTSKPPFFLQKNEFFTRMGAKTKKNKHLKKMLHFSFSAPK